MYGLTVYSKHAASQPSFSPNPNQPINHPIDSAARCQKKKKKKKKKPYLDNLIIPTNPTLSPLLRVRPRQRPGNLLDNDAHKVGTRLTADEVLRFLERDEENVDIECGQADRWVRVKFRHGFGEGLALVGWEGRRMVEDAPERHGRWV